MINSLTLWYLQSGLSRLAISMLISQSDLHSPTWITLCITPNGAHQERKLSFSAKVAAGKIISAKAIVVGLWKRSTANDKVEFL